MLPYEWDACSYFLFVYSASFCALFYYCEALWEFFYVKKML